SPRGRSAVHGAALARVRQYRRARDPSRRLPRISELAEPAARRGHRVHERVRRSVSLTRHSGRAQREPKSITTTGNELKGSWLWIPGSRLRRPPEVHKIRSFRVPASLAPCPHSGAST